MTAPTLGLALIAKDEEETLPNLLASVSGAFDQVVLADTGSTDRTVEVFEEWAAVEGERNPDFISTVGRFEWCDDFAAARNYADSLLDTDWLAWADCDDTIVGADRLRGVAADVPGHVNALVFDYYIALVEPTAEEPSPDPAIGKDYVRLVRRGSGPRWSGRMHEWKPYPAVDEALAVEASLARWVTRRSPVRASSCERNMRILRRWIADEPTNLIPRRTVAAEEMLTGDIHRALEDLEDYLELKGPSMTAHEAQMAQYAVPRLKEVIGNTPADIPPDQRGVLEFLFVIAIDLPMFQASQPQSEAEVEANAEAPPVERRTRQQRRAEARARAKELAAA